ncbi:MAG: DUF1631 domain-containing protein [Pseudomonadales bacterium]|nr:DUF1631 domain-containing protein [Pseudomonadales bacterium]
MKQTLPVELVELKKNALSSLQALLAGMFDQADDWLFEKANKSVEPTAQQEYLDAMRLIRLQRANVEKKYFKYLSDQFSALAKGESPAIDSEQPLSDLSLALVGHEEMEQSVALDTMAARVRSGCDISLRTLEARIQSVLGLPVSAVNNPLDPSHLCQALRNAIKETDWEIKYQLIFFKLFQMYVLKPYGEIVHTANQQLCNAGVLRGLSDIEVLQGNNGSRSESNIDGAAADPLSMGAIADPEEQVADWQGASQQPSVGPTSGMAGFASGLGIGRDALRSQDFSSVVAGALNSISQPTTAAPIASVIGSALGSAKPIELPDLLASIHQLQQNHRQPGQAISTADLLARLSDLIQRDEQEKGPQRVSDIDTNIINLVSMLFDFVLSDEQLPHRVKAEIARLQIPYLKVAVVDAGFLSSNKHAARKLINELAQAGLGLAEDREGEGDSVFAEIQRIVQTILDEFSDDVTLIETLLADFRSFMQRENKRSEVVSQRVAALEEGKYRNELAKQEVADALHAMLQGKPMPSAMAAVIQQPWQAYLCWIHHKKGKDSPEWVKAFYVVQQMLFCLEPVANHEEAEDREAVIDEVFAHLKAGCEAIGFNHHQLIQWLNELQAIYRANAAFVDEESIDDGTAAVDEEKRSEFERLSQELDADLAALGLQEADVAAESAPLTIDEPTEKPVSEVSERHQAAIDERMRRLRAPRIPVTADVNKVTLLDVTKPLAESRKAESAVASQLPALPEDDSGMQKAMALPVGSWLQYESPSEPGKLLKCKLAAHIKAVDKLIFVNRSGAKLFEKMLLEVAHDINDGRLQLLDDSQLFDRALESVISSLRDVREKAV